LEKSLEPDLYDFLRGQLNEQVAPLIRLAAASALSTVPLDTALLAGLADAIPAAGAMELPQLVAAFERTGDRELGRRLIAALEACPSRESLPAESLRKILRNYPEEVQKSAEPLLRRLEVDTQRQHTRLAELEPVLSGGIPFQGRGVFFGTKGACISCHTVGSSGGKVGPDLSKIGSIRTPRDLLESVVYPSASFVRSYEPYVVTTTDGVVLTGLLARDTADAIHLVGPDRVEHRISRPSIDQMLPGRVSIMPQGLDAQLTSQELRDLIAYLSSLK
jgi:putative heme-binding domain-containing protein